MSDALTSQEAADEAAYREHAASPVTAEEWAQGAPALRLAYFAGLKRGRETARQPDETPAEQFDPPVIQAVYTRGGKALVCGRPGTYSNLPDEDDRHHNCDAMGCSSIEHVLWRGPLTVDEPPETTRGGE